MVVWMEIDLKNKELPLAVADSAPELARITGDKEANVYSGASKWKHGIRRRYIRVEIPDDEDD